MTFNLCLIIKILNGNINQLNKLAADVLRTYDLLRNTVFMKIFCSLGKYCETIPLLNGTKEIQNHRVNINMLCCDIV